MTDKSIKPPTESVVAETDGIKSDAAKEDAVDWRAALLAVEFCCWVVVLLAPLLRWINGAAVTYDQLYVQAALVALTLFGAVALRIVNWRRSRQ